MSDSFFEPVGDTEDLIDDFICATNERVPDHFDPKYRFEERVGRLMCVHPDVTRDEAEAVHQAPVKNGEVLQQWVTPSSSLWVPKRKRKR